MSYLFIKRALAAALFLNGLGTAAATLLSALSEPGALAFEIMKREVKRGQGLLLKARLFDVRTSGTVLPILAAKLLGVSGAVQGRLILRVVL